MTFDTVSAPTEEETEAVFGETLRAHRTALGLTQERLAERALISEQAIGALERGTRRFPRKDTVVRLANALGLHGDERTRFEACASRRGAPRPDRVCAARFAELEGVVQDLVAQLRTLQHAARPLD